MLIKKLIDVSKQNIVFIKNVNVPTCSIADRKAPGQETDLEVRMCSKTERRVRVVKTPASYWGGLGFKSRLRYWLSLQRFFVVSLGPSTQMLG
jgi:hypothetical protein